MKVPLTLMVVITITSACNKKHREVLPAPVANFSIVLDNQIDDGSLASSYPTNAVLRTKNNSTQSTGFLWNFGDERTSKEEYPMVVYSQSGNYKLMLTATANNQQDSVAKIIKIVDRYIDSISLSSLNWNASFHDNLQWEPDEQAEVFFRIYEREEFGLPGITGQQYDANKIYESASIMTSPSQLPVKIPVNQQIILDYPYSKTNIGYTLYARKDGQEYLLMSNWGSGFGPTYRDDYDQRRSFYNLAFNGINFTIHASY